MKFMMKPKVDRFVYRVVFSQMAVFSTANKIYIGIDRFFTSRKAALTFYRNLIKHSDFSGKDPIYSTAFGGDLAVGFFADFSVFSFCLTSKKL